MPRDSRPFARTRRALLPGLAPLVLLACGEPASPPAAEEARPVRVSAVEPRREGDAIALAGTVQAETEASLAFRINGRMVERLVSPGDRLRAGRPVARLDPADEENALRAARAALSAAQGQVVETRNKYGRQHELLASGFTTRVRYDQATQLLRSADAQLDAAQAQLAIATDRLAYTVLYADAPGTVVAPGAEPGEVVAAGRMIIRLALSIDTLRAMPVPLPDDRTVPLAQIAIFAEEQEYPLVWRRDRVPTLTVLAVVPAMVPAMVAAMLTVPMVQLQGFGKLALVVATLPLGIIDVVLALLAFRQPLGLVAILGILALLGMIAKNAVILIVQIEAERGSGLPLRDAVVGAAASRFRPMMLTAASAVLGMVPIAPTVFWGKMAFAIMGGLLVATLLTFVFLPVLYVIAFDRAAARGLATP